MTDLLHRLALRALGEGPRVWPQSQRSYGGFTDLEPPTPPLMVGASDLDPSREEQPSGAPQPRVARLSDPLMNAEESWTLDADQPMGPIAERTVAKAAPVVVGVSDLDQTPAGQPSAGVEPSVGGLREPLRKAEQSRQTETAMPKTPSAEPSVLAAPAADSPVAKGAAPEARLVASRQGATTPTASEGGSDPPAERRRPPEMAEPLPLAMPALPPQPAAAEVSMPTDRDTLPMPSQRIRAALENPAAPSAASRAAGREPREEPVIQVTIGRVEIRASVAAPAAAARPAPAPAGPQPLSLDGYLRNRKGSAG
jgi:hypothetical protein